MAYLGNGIYDLMDVLKASSNPQINYEGLYQDPMSKLATANPLKAIFNPDFEYRSPSFIERFAKEGATNPEGFVPIDYDRAIDFKRLFEDRPLKPTDGVKRFENFDPRVGTITPFQPYENPTYQMKQQLGMVPTGITASSAAQDVSSVPFGTSVDNIQGFTDKEDFSEPETKTGIAKLFEFLQKFSPSGMVMQGLNALGSMMNFKDSPMYRPAGTGVFGYTPEQLNRMNALGGYYSEPMREFRRRSNRISNLLQRAAEGKNFSQKNLDNLMGQFGMGDVDTRGMIDSIKASADLGYGKGGGRDFDSGRDYSSSPGAIAGDMEYGEE